MRKRTLIFILATLALSLVLCWVISFPLDVRLLALTPKIIKYKGLIQQHAAKEALDARLVCALIVQESGFNEKAESAVGALGLTQLMPTTAKALGVQDPFDADQNIAGATRHLRTLYNAFRESPHEHRHRLVLASYNGGLGRVRDAQALVRHHQDGRSTSLGTCEHDAQPIDETAHRHASRGLGRAANRPTGILRVLTRRWRT